MPYMPKEQYIQLSSGDKKAYHIQNIKDEIPWVDIKQYSHNIIGLQLGMLRKFYEDDKTFNGFVRLMFPELKALGWRQYWDEME